MSECKLTREHRRILYDGRGFNSRITQHQYIVQGVRHAGLPRQARGRGRSPITYWYQSLRRETWFLCAQGTGKLVLPNYNG